MHHAAALQSNLATGCWGPMGATVRSG